MKKATKTDPLPLKATDPLNVNIRLYRQLGKLLDDMESMDRDDTMTFPQRISALIAVGRVQKIFADLRKADFNAGAGSQVTRYAAAFKAPDAVGGRKASARKPVIELVELDSVSVSISDDDDDDDDPDAA